MDKISRRHLLASLGIVSTAPVYGFAPEKRWTAMWITAPEAPAFDYGVHHFRLQLDLPSIPSSFPIHVTADNRYQLFVNGRRVVWGPARGDLFHWRYETLDLAAYLREGRNTLAAVVWNFGDLAPEAQVTYRTGFLLQGGAAISEVANTGNAWKAYTNRAYTPLPKTTSEMRGYFVVGPGDRVNAAVYPWGWETPGFDDSTWRPAKAIGLAALRDAVDGPTRWMLVPRNIPFMEESINPPLTFRLAEGVSLPQAFPLEIAANSKVRFILDQMHLTTAYPELFVTGGQGATITLSYAEALYNRGGKRGDKGNRNQVEGKDFIGYQDVFLPDGADRTFRPLWWRTYRYIELIAITGNAPVTINNLQGQYTGYPFQRKARFNFENKRLEQVLDVGWRTARLCAHETYMDCPYYEQLQYAGDTRIQALISLYSTGDDRLMRNAILELNDSRTAEGATMSRAPSRLQQYIPSFCLWWIGMVHDFWMYRDDPAFVKSMLPGVRAVLAFFAAHQKANGSLNYLPWWRNFDWVSEWPKGEPPTEEDGSSAPFDFQYLLALNWATALEDGLGSPSQAQALRATSSKLAATARALYWNAGKSLFADTPRQAQYSQHSNVLAVLSGAIQGAQARAVIETTLSDVSLAKCSYYFRHYLHSAVNHVGLGDRYVALLADWFAMIDRGLTTFEERPPGSANASRSDCHAWSASPNFEIFRTILGIDSAAPGFKRVRIRPFLCGMPRAAGSVPHPKGEIAVRLSRTDRHLDVFISLPSGTTGEFVWKSAVRTLAAGYNEFRMNLV